MNQRELSKALTWYPGANPGKTEDRAEPDIAGRVTAEEVWRYERLARRGQSARSIARRCGRSRHRRQDGWRDELVRPAILNPIHSSGFRPGCLRHDTIPRPGDCADAQPDFLVTSGFRRTCGAFRKSDHGSRLVVRKEDVRDQHRAHRDQPESRVHCAECMRAARKAE